LGSKLTQLGLLANVTDSYPSHKASIEYSCALEVYVADLFAEALGPEVMLNLGKIAKILNRGAELPKHDPWYNIILSLTGAAAEFMFTADILPSNIGAVVDQLSVGAGEDKPAWLKRNSGIFRFQIAPGDSGYEEHEIDAIMIHSGDKVVTFQIKSAPIRGGFPWEFRRNSNPLPAEKIVIGGHEGFISHHHIKATFNTALLYEILENMYRAAQ